NEKRDRSLRLFLAKIIECGGGEGGNRALHVDRAAAEQFSVFQHADEGWLAPARFPSGWHDVGMACEDEMRLPAADLREQIIDIGKTRGGEIFAGNFLTRVRGPA